MKKKNKLILYMVLSFIFCCVIWYVGLLFGHNVDIMLLIGLVFYIACLGLGFIIYYLSIIADALNRRYKEREEKGGKK